MEVTPAKRIAPASGTCEGKALDGLERVVQLNFAEREREREREVIQHFVFVQPKETALSARPEGGAARSTKR